jgi:ribosomal protein L31E
MRLRSEKQKKKYKGRDEEEKQVTGEEKINRRIYQRGRKKIEK